MKIKRGMTRYVVAGQGRSRRVFGSHVTPSFRAYISSGWVGSLLTASTEAGEGQENYLRLSRLKLGTTSRNCRLRRQVQYSTIILKSRVSRQDRQDRIGQEMRHSIVEDANLRRIRSFSSFSLAMLAASTISSSRS